MISAQLTANPRPPGRTGERKEGEGKKKKRKKRKKGSAPSVIQHQDTVTCPEAGHLWGLAPQGRKGEDEGKGEKGGEEEKKESQTCIGGDDALIPASPVANPLLIEFFGNDRDMHLKKKKKKGGKGKRKGKKGERVIQIIASIHSMFAIIHLIATS